MSCSSKTVTGPKNTQYKRYLMLPQQGLRCCTVLYVILWVLFHPRFCVELNHIILSLFIPKKKKPWNASQIRPVFSNHGYSSTERAQSDFPSRIIIWCDCRSFLTLFFSFVTFKYWQNSCVIFFIFYMQHSNFIFVQYLLWDH